MIKYLNIKTSQGIKTWEIVDSKDFKTIKQFKEEIRSIKDNYLLMGYSLYTSQRACK